MEKKILLIDGFSILNRAFYGVPLLTNKDGIYTNGIYGFLSILFKLLEEEQPDYISVALDLPEKTFRHIKYEEYKGTRKGMPEELKMQVPLLIELLDAMNIHMASKAGFEADDILGTFANMAVKDGIMPVIVSGDRDMLQVASDIIKIRIPKTKQGKTETEDYYAKDVFIKYGVTPKEFIDVKALMGDSSDNVPGVPSIGEKTAIKIIEEYSSLENAIKNAENIKPKKASENLIAYKEQAELSKELVTIDCNVKVDFIPSNMVIEPYTENALKIIKNLQFKSFYERFSKAAKPAVEENQEIKTVDDNEIKNILNAINEETAYHILKIQNDILGISLYTKKLGMIFWHNTKGDISLFKSFFENEKITKIAHNVKRDLHTLYEKNIALNGVIFDTFLGAYILDATKETYDFADLANDYLNEHALSDEEFFGKGKLLKKHNDIEISVMANYSGNCARICLLCKEIMYNKLKENNQLYLYEEIELPLAYVLWDMEITGIKVNKDTLLSYQVTLGEQIDKLTQIIYADAGCEFNINSPKQLGIVLFEGLSLPGGKKNQTGYKTSADVLEKLIDKHPIISNILMYRQLTKLKSTYVDGLLNVYNEEKGKIFSTFNQTVTATGRISSTEPNLQNIPIRLALGRELRKVFVPEDGYVFLDGDYSQIELRVLAHLADDEVLIDAFNNDMDIHRLTASQVFHVPFEEVTDSMRSAAKAVNFGIVYGISAFGLGQDLNISRKQGEKYIESYFIKYPEIKAYLDNLVLWAKNKGYAETMFHRWRFIPELAGNNFIMKSFGERVAMNMPIQGSAADIIKLAMVKMHKRLKEEGLKSRIILQVHDELLVEAYIDEKETVKKMLKEEMENAVSLRVPLTVDVHEGENWFAVK